MVTVRRFASVTPALTMSVEAEVTRPIGATIVAEPSRERVM